MDFEKMIFDLLERCSKKWSVAKYRELLEELRDFCEEELK